MKGLLKFLKYFLITILSILAIIFISVFIQTKTNPNKIPSIFGYKPFIVLSGSMQSKISKGDLVIVKNSKDFKVNDIIAFRDKDNYVVTHRIIDIKDYDGTKKYVTKGDNNNVKDQGEVSTDKIEGKYFTNIKGFGNVLLILKKPITLIFTLILITIFGFFWIFFENNKLSKEEKEELERLRLEKQQENNQDN